MRAITHPPLTCCGEAVHETDLSEGTCYRAVNWIEVGTTTGRGRQDLHHRRHGTQPKTIWLYPLRRDARQRLCRAG